MKAEQEREYADYVAARLPVLHRAAYLLTGDAHRADDILDLPGGESVFGHSPVEVCAISADGTVVAGNQRGTTGSTPTIWRRLS